MANCIICKAPSGKRFRCKECNRDMRQKRANARRKARRAMDRKTN